MERSVVGDNDSLHAFKEEARVLAVLLVLVPDKFPIPSGLGK